MGYRAKNIFVSNTLILVDQFYAVQYVRNVGIRNRNSLRRSDNGLVGKAMDSLSAQRILHFFVGFIKDDDLRNNIKIEVVIFKVENTELYLPPEPFCWLLELLW